MNVGWNADQLAVLDAAARRLADGFDLPPMGPAADDPAGLNDVLLETAARLQDNFPYFHPRYAGQMLKPPHPVARLAYALAMLVNPNNHALDGGRASSRMEQEAVAELAAMVGWRTHLGHLTGGGTMANLEALWIASRLAPGATILASSAAHYTHRRLSEVLGVRFDAVPVDPAGRLDADALARRLARGDVGTVVATLGTTGLGALDPLADILALRRRYEFRVHVDAAYGGYFGLAGSLPPTLRAIYQALPEADSVVVDPHKHGLQPYGCGAILYRDPQVARLYRHDSPYTYFTDADLHLGEISLECSRAGAAATALWATHRLLPLVRGGRFAADLDRCLAAAREWHRRLSAHPGFLTLPVPDLDIVVWAPAAESASQVSEASRALFEQAARHDLHLALIRLDAELVAQHWPHLVNAGDAPVTCLRCCLMKPEHLDWIDELWETLCIAHDAVARGQARGGGG